MKTFLITFIAVILGTWGPVVAGIFGIRFVLKKRAQIPVALMKRVQLVKDDAKRKLITDTVAKALGNAITLANIGKRVEEILTEQEKTNVV